MPIVIGVKFSNSGKSYYFDPCAESFKVGDGVIVETARGVEFGKVSVANIDIPENKYTADLKPVLRRATEADLKRVEENNAKRTSALKIADEKIKQHDLKMKLVDVEYSFDRSKIIIYFTADGRVDFRELVKDLASVLHNRIELRQIYERDDIKMRGAIAACGRPCCCANHLAEFEKSSIKMAKIQGLSLNPAKICGVCGKLMCCLKYENAYYADTIKLMPKYGARVSTPDGIGTVEDQDILRRLIKARVELADGTFDVRSYKLEDIKRLSQATLADDVAVLKQEEKELEKLED